LFINDWLGFDQRLVTATAPAGSFSENPSGSSGSGILATVASEKKRRHVATAASITSTAPGNCLPEFINES
jgi:hypothetical protein